MTTSRFEKFLAVAGILAAALFVGSALHADPQVDATAGEQVQWYLSHKGQMLVSAVTGGYFAVAMLFFTTGVRRVLRSGEPGESTYSTAVLAGGILVSVATILSSVVLMASVKAANEHQGGALTTFAFINEFDWLPLIAGLAVFYLAAGLGGLRTAMLPKWLSIVTIAVGATCLLGPLGVIAWFATPLWLVVTAIVMLRLPSDLPAAPSPLAYSAS